MSLVDDLALPLDFAALVQLLYVKRFTGAIILNFSQGVPLAVDVPSTQIRFTRGTDLDKGGRRGASSPTTK